MRGTASKPAGWFHRWWGAVLGAVALVGGVVLYEYSFWSIPRGTARYYAPSNAFTALFSPGSLALRRLGEALVVIGLIAVITTIVVRLIRRRRTPASPSPAR